MRPWKQLLFILTLAAIILDIAVPAAFASECAEEVLRIVNEERLANELKPLAMDEKLLSVSRVRAEEASVCFEHTRPNGRDARSIVKDAKYSRYGENLAVSQSNDAENIVRRWMDSVSHRENILGSRYTKMGVACVQGADGLYYWAQEFSCD